jgi:hypothetical protein
MAGIRFCADVFIFSRLVEAGPTAARIVFGLGIKENCATADAAEDAFFFEVVVFSAERAFGAFLTGDLILQVGELLPPFFVRFFDFIVHFLLRVVSVYSLMVGRIKKMVDLVSLFPDSFHLC